MKEIKINATKTIEKKVVHEMLANQVGSGEVAVLATPMMIAFMEECASTLLKEYLDEGETSVGIVMNTTHDAATPAQMKVRVTAEIIEVNGKKVTFKILAKDEKDVIGTATHDRFIVMKEKFESKAQAKLN